MNDALLMKLGWNIMTNPDDLWNNTLEIFFDPDNALIPADAKINRATTESGSWDTTLLELLLPQQVVSKIRACPPPEAELGHDVLTWSGDETGRFTTKSAYDLLSKEKA
ncbi:hypothetical protein RIF29_03956 [Crotalaria pallida]|uniref:Uncharacterized protein n=1 Tax=Crotalaria pallida TaxID=3830 RepID=A0AAN9J1A5_CROPI